VITSLKNPKVAAAVRLKKRAFRETDGRFLVEGPQSVREALASGAVVDVLFHGGPPDERVEAARRAGVETIQVSEDVMSKLTSTVTPQGVVAVVRFVHVGLEALPPEPACVAVLHSVRDPGNAGTVLRSADAAGADAVVFSATSVDVYNPKTVRASAGSLFHLPVARAPGTAQALDVLRSRGCRVYAMDAGGDADLYELDLTLPTTFLFGNEAWGLPSEVASLADAIVRVPIRGRAESLNLAAAATVCLFEWARQLREGRRVALESVIASAAHDIRSPLTAMKGFGYALATRWDQMAEEHRTLMLQGIVYDTDRLNMIVRQLVDAARVVGDALELYPERVDVAALVEKVAQSAARDPDRPPVMWEGQDRPVAFLDPDRLQLVLEAFVEAEVWWAGEGPIRVTARRTDGRLVLETFRAGTELTPEAAVALFEPRAPGAGAGSKIGLFVANGVAEAQGGTVAVEVADGGLRFRLDVPVGEGERPV
jgi:RNA methyltransferase, TrmH family